jgi:hypothetical protein
MPLFKYIPDYVEATFTPELRFGGNNVGMTYSSRQGSGIKIGNRFIFFINLVLSAKGTSTGAAAITGFPFTVVTQEACNIMTHNLTLAFSQYRPLTTVGGTGVTIYKISGVSFIGVSDPEFNNDSELFISGVCAV